MKFSWVNAFFLVVFFCALSASQAKAENLDELFKKAFSAAWEDPREGRVLFEKGLVLARKQKDKEKEALFLLNLGGIATTIGDYPKALDHYAQSMAIQKTLPNPEEMEARILANFGLTYEDIGDYAKATQHFTEAIALMRKISQKWDEATFLGNLGRVYQKLGDPSRALEQHRAALEVAKELKDKERQGVAWDNIGLALIELSDFKGALEAFKTALELSKAANGFPNPALIEGHISDLYLAQRNPKGFMELSKSRTGIRMANYYLMSNQLDLAKTLFQGVIAEAKKYRRADLLVSSHLGLSLTLEKLGQKAEARTSYDTTIAEIERQRELLPLTARQTFLSGKGEGILPRLEAYQGRARVSENAADGFYWAENTKARAFVESLSERFRTTASELPAELARSEKEISERVVSLSKQMNISYERNKMSRYDELAPELATAKKEQAALIAKLRESHPKYASLLYPEPAKAEKIALLPKEVLLEYEVTESGTLLFILRAGKPVERVDIPISRDELRELVQRFRLPFENPQNEDGTFKDEFDAEAGARLFSLLFKPVIDKKAATSEAEIIIVPSEVLGLLPFEALRPGEEARYLGEDYDIAYAQSASSLTQSRTLAAKKNSSKKIFILADPVFGRSDSRVGKATVLAKGAQEIPAGNRFESQATRAIAKRMGGSEDSSFVRLAETGVLARATTKLFGAEATTLVGLKATKQDLLKTDLAKFRMLVFATHGILDNDVPYIREPALVLSQVDGKGAPLNGFLKMSEVMDLRLNAELVALTACKTGLGHSIGGEGVVGLGRAFQYAGAGNVLVSLWSVAEKSTTLMTEAVLERLKSGDSPRQALKKARLKIRKLGFEHPFFWAPFVIVGS